MKLNELIKSFSIAMSNEEKALLDQMHDVRPLDSFTEREQAIIENLVRKSLVSKIHNKGSTLVMANEFQ
jgi:hypothetical protein